MNHRCEAIHFAQGGGYYQSGFQCPDYETKLVSDRWLCWVHRVSLAKPEPRQHAPMQFVPKKSP